MSDLRITGGEPSAEDVAIIVALLRSTPAKPDEPKRQGWGRPILRTPIHPGVGAWRQSLR